MAHWALLVPALLLLAGRGSPSPDLPFGWWPLYTPLMANPSPPCMEASLRYVRILNDTLRYLNISSLTLLKSKFPDLHQQVSTMSNLLL